MSRVAAIGAIAALALGGMLVRRHDGPVGGGFGCRVNGCVDGSVRRRLERHRHDRPDRGGRRPRAAYARRSPCRAPGAATAPSSTDSPAKYGIPINNLNPDGSSQQELDAITANKANKGPAAPDVIDVGLSYGPKAVSEGLLAPYKVSTWADIADSAKDPNGNWYGDYYGVMSFEVNTSVITTVPQDWSDLLTQGKNTVSLAGDPDPVEPGGLGGLGGSPRRTAVRSTTPSRASTSSRS